MTLQKFTFFAAITTMLLCAVVNDAQAQDPNKKQTIEITSSYKPSLRNPVKIDLTATPVAPDTTRPRMAYFIPPQNLFFAYQPALSRPLSLQADTGILLGNRNQLKVGFGNFSTPYVNGNFSFGDGKTSLFNLSGDYISSKGKIKYQDFSEMGVKGTGSIFTSGHEIDFGIGFANSQYFQYGYDHEIFSNYTADELKRNYQDISVNLGMKNTEVNEAGINYNPTLSYHKFGRETYVSENNLIVNIPAEKKFGDHIMAKLAASGDFNSYQIKSNSLKVSNSLLQIAPAIVYYSDVVSINAGMSPTWNNSELSVLPNLYAELQIEPNVFSIQAGWIGKFIPNTFRSLAKENPYMQDPISFQNTKETQYYGGIKASLGSHFNFNAKVGYLSYKNMPLFINDNFDGKSFLISNESSMSNFQLHGDINYISQDQFTLTAGMDLNTYSGLKDNTNAWGLYPLKLYGSIRWNPIKDLIIKGDLATFSGAKALNPDKSVKDLNGGTDLSAGAEYKITKMFSAWLDFNNVLNSKYQRINQYPVYGFQVLGGVIIRF